MKLRLIAAALTAFGPCACNMSQAQAGENYTLKASVPNHEGEMAYVMDFDTGAKLDSAVVTKGVALMKGSITQPVLVRMVYGGKRGPVILLEKGSIQIDSQGTASGTQLNKKLEAVSAQLVALAQQAQALGNDSSAMEKFKVIEADYNRVLDQAVAENAQNPVGLYYFMQQAERMTLPELNAALARYPSMAQSQRIARIKQELELKDQTMPGNKFKDFTVEYNGKNQVFSDYLNKDGYTLVDFWASWCGPCIRATKTLKELNNRFGDKGLKIVGVAVWDKPDDTLQAIKSHDLPWPSIINAQKIPTDIYGISGIPCIMLIGPDGTILSRDKQGQELINVVEQYFK